MVHLVHSGLGPEATSLSLDSVAGRRLLQLYGRALACERVYVRLETGGAFLQGALRPALRASK